MSRKIKRYAGFFLGKLFRSRNIIIVSAGEVKHYPISSKVFAAGVFGFMALLSWISYSTGGYLAAASIMAEKDRKIESTTIANRRIEAQYSLLKQDLGRLQDGKTDVNSEYESFVIQQHKSNDAASGVSDEDALSDDGLEMISQNLLQERINYLEGVVDQLKGEQVTLLSSLHERTGEQISVYKDVIASTGLSLSRLSKHPKAKLKIREILDGEQEDETADADNKEVDTAFVNQGGPFVPADPMNLSEEESVLLKDVDQMMALNSIVTSLPLAKPMEEAKITSAFGRRVDPLSRRWATHNGMDFVSSADGKVGATADGKVVTAGRSGAYGFMVEIDHGFGITTRYAHMKQLRVKKGDEVKKGDVIGLQGNSGRSTGSHLHYEVRFNRSALNPNKFIKVGNEHVF